MTFQPLLVKKYWQAGDRGLLVVMLLVAGLLLTIAISLCQGAVPLGFGNLWQALWHQGEPLHQTIVWELRLPRIAAA